MQRPAKPFSLVRLQVRSPICFGSSMVERRPVKPMDIGSSPIRSAISAQFNSRTTLSKSEDRGAIPLAGANFHFARVGRRYSKVSRYGTTSKQRLLIMRTTFEKAIPLIQSCNSDGQSSSLIRKQSVVRVHPRLPSAGKQVLKATKTIGTRFAEHCEVELSALRGRINVVTSVRAARG